MRNPKRNRINASQQYYRIKLDVTNPTQIESTIQQVLLQHDIDVVLNNAAI
jgi:NADP-dependent 3-hydroxy acid dehydrogenase YdfG